MGRTKIEQLGDQAEILVHQSRRQGKSYREIAAEVSDHFNTDVSHQAIKNYLENFGNERLARLGAQGAKEIQREELKKVLDVEEQLIKLNTKLQNAVDELNERDVQDLGMLLKVSQEIRQQLKFHREYIEEFVNPDNVTNNIEYNQTDVVMELNQHFNKLQRDGAFVCKNCGHRHIKIDAEAL